MSRRLGYLSPLRLEVTLLDSGLSLLSNEGVLRAARNDLATRGELSNDISSSDDRLGVSSTDEGLNDVVVGASLLDDVELVAKLEHLGACIIDSILTLELGIERGISADALTLLGPGAVVDLSAGSAVLAECAARLAGGTPLQGRGCLAALLSSRLGSRLSCGGGGSGSGCWGVSHGHGDEHEG